MLYISMGSMINLPSIKGLDMHENAISYTTVMLIITICFIFYGFDIIKSGFKNLVHKTPNMDTLVTIGVSINSAADITMDSADSKFSYGI